MLSNLAGSSRALRRIPVRSILQVKLFSSEVVSHVSRLQRATEFRKENQVKLTGRDTDNEMYYPFYNYSKEDAAETVAEEDAVLEATPFFAGLKKVMRKEGFTKPTAIQAQSWPIVVNNRDVISVARTGSGKTVGFLLPGFQKLMMENEEKRNATGSTSNSKGDEPRSKRRGQPTTPPRVLVLAPTRELVVQIDDEAQKYCVASGLKSTAIFGGASKSTQISKLRAGIDFIVATPGRCNDLADMGVLDLSNIQYLVLDEADRMLDMGFEPQIRDIIAQIPEKRQTLFFTATWPREVEAIAKEFVKDPIQVNIGDSDQLNANKAIKQNIEIVREHEKEDRLFNLFDNEINSLEVNPTKNHALVAKSLVFVSRKMNCDHIAEQLRYEGYKVASLHGDMQQVQRQRVLDNFKAGKIRVLVATDVAGRGLDVKDIQNVINYDFPEGTSGVEDYVHRIGRTARGEFSHGIG
jgi:ATP-dependent RNA helicase DDX5/DBP2